VLAQPHTLDGKTLALKPADGNDRGGAAPQPILRFAADPYKGQLRASKG